jgi:50S ribosomal subunit-associated GTPase HflX
MKRCIVLGKPNVGKTLLALALADYVKAKDVEITFQDPGGAGYSRKYPMDIAIRELVGTLPHQTKCLQSLSLEFRAGKGKKTVELVDTTGLIDEIHDDPLTRKAMAQTLSAIRGAQIIIHVIDAHLFGHADGLSDPREGDLDMQLAAFAGPRGGYCIVANKMDLPGAKRGLARIRRLFTGYKVLPVSAATREGLKEVRRHVLHNL